MKNRHLLLTVMISFILAIGSSAVQAETRVGKKKTDGSKTQTVAQTKQSTTQVNSVRGARSRTTISVPRQKARNTQQRTGRGDLKQRGAGKGQDVQSP